MIALWATLCCSGSNGAPAAAHMRRTAPRTFRTPSCTTFLTGCGPAGVARHATGERSNTLRATGASSAIRISVPLSRAQASS
jgi:hypothetical protein